MLGSVRAGTLSYSVVKLFSKYSNLPTCVKIIPERRHRQTDGQLDGQKTYCGITVLCISSGGEHSVNVVLC